MASPSPRLWKPMPIAIIRAMASRRSDSLPVISVCLLEIASSKQEGCDRADANQANALKCGWYFCSDFQRFGDRIQSEEDQQTGGGCHQKGHGAATELPQRREPEDAQKDRDDANI